MYKAIARIYPRFVREKIKKLLICAGIKGKVNADSLIGFSLLLSAILAAFFSIISASFIKLGYVNNILFSVAIFIILQVLFYFLILLKADSRAKFVEDILPDALQLTASNLKAGYTIERALLLSARPEFGPFSDELAMIGKEIATGKNIENAMLAIAGRIKSEKLEKTIMLIVQGIKSGGELAILLSETAQNLRHQALVEERARASALTYFIFILSALAFATPILFALSSFLAEVIMKQLSVIETPAGIATIITVKKVSISSNFIVGFIVTTLTTLCVLGSITLGLIRKGKGKEGLRYIPILLILSLGIFFSVRFFISKMLSSLI